MKGNGPHRAVTLSYEAKGVEIDITGLDFELLILAGHLSDKSLIT
jgi:hypothetical protein